MGLYLLRPSPLHARSVALVLNVTTGLASPAHSFTANSTIYSRRRIQLTTRLSGRRPKLSYFINDTSQHSSSTTAPSTSERVLLPLNDMTIIPHPTAPSAPPTAPFEQPLEMPANEGAPAPVAHPETQQQQNSPTEAVPPASTNITPRSSTRRSSFDMTLRTIEATAAKAYCPASIHVPILGSVECWRF